MLNEESENIHARVYKSEKEKLAIVVFRGTQFASLKNWQVDADVRRVEVPLGLNSSAHVHEGFLDALNRILPSVRAWVSGGSVRSGNQHARVGTEPEVTIPGGWRLVFAGHSMGGALAVLAATLAEAQGWPRGPDAVVTFGAPRVADSRLSTWWENRGLCAKLLRVSVYNDVVPYMPLGAVFAGLQDIGHCLLDMKGCLLRLGLGSFEGIRFSDEWTHICPSSEFLVPGAMRGVNAHLQDFSPLGGVLSHFLGNALFGYGYGMLYGGLLLHDAHCGISPAVFPSFECAVVEDLTSVECMGLELDSGAEDPNSCKKSCCADSDCEVWQWTQDGNCWRGRSQECVQQRWAKYMLAGQRVH